MARRTGQASDHVGGHGLSAVTPDILFEEAMPTILSLPLSGAVVGELVNAFDLRRWDPREVLSSTNATRVFRGERIGDDSEFRGKIAPDLGQVCIDVNQTRGRDREGVLGVPGTGTGFREARAHG